jgi:hypothetical protein
VRVRQQRGTETRGPDEKARREQEAAKNERSYSYLPEVLGRRRETTVGAPGRVSLRCRGVARKCAILRIHLCERCHLVESNVGH